ncbi:ribonuclease III [Paxillus ammoniavirescens]|nr:ribonuclease III [Paxillus ammoniavirescens]
MPLNPPSALRPNFTEEHPFPPLPPIYDEQIRTQMITHRSFYARPNHVFEDHPDDPSPDNENHVEAEHPLRRFEHLGDSVLGLVVTGLLIEMYPNLRVGPSTKIRALVVGNATLAEISRRYALPAQLKLHPAQAITLRASINVQADAFEASSYIGGLFLDQGLAAVEPWLKALFGPYATEAYLRVRVQHGLPPLPALTAPPLATTTSVSSASSGSSARSGTGTSASTSGGRAIEPARTRATSASAYRPPHHHPHASGNSTTAGHLGLFNQHLQRARREVEWVYADGVGEGTNTTPIWVVRVEVDGEVYGKGRGGTKKAARNEAAKEGLVKMGIIV